MGTCTHVKPFDIQFHSLQTTILVIQIFMIAMGGCIFGLGVAIRPILRLTNPDYFTLVQIICDIMLSVGLLQIFTAALNCFMPCLKIVWTLFLAAIMNGVIILVEVVGIGSGFVILAKVDTISEEDIQRAWYLWECQHAGSCSRAMATYVHRYMVPQIALSAIAVLLQCLSIMYLSRAARCLNEKQMRIEKNREECVLNQISYRNFDIETAVRDSVADSLEGFEDSEPESEPRVLPPKSGSSKMVTFAPIFVDDRRSPTTSTQGSLNSIKKC